MIPLDTLGVFFAASVALGISPGPDNIFVLAQSALHGRGAGMLVTLGLCTGLLIHTALVSLGVATLFADSAMAFGLLKTLGAAYLLYLAWRAFRAGQSDLAAGAERPVGARRLYGRGVIMNLSNPKVAIFFLAFLPQFADPARGALAAQLMLLGMVFILATLLVFGSIAWFAGSLGEWLKKAPRAQRMMNRAAGVVFVGLALRLVTTEP